MHVYLCFKVSIDSIPPSDEKKRTDRGMMTDLLTINWTAIYESLECFSKNRIEGFLDVEIKDAISKSEGYALLEAL